MRSTLTLPLILISGGLVAQPAITAADAPAIGEQFTYNGDGLFVDLSTGGSDQTWDFSGSGGSLGNTLTVVAASAGMGASAFPDADVALATSGFEEYIGITSAGLEHMGQYIGSDNVVYTDPELYLPIPCVYGQTWSDDFAGQWGGGATTFTGTTSAMASGFGSLILPSITLTNVLRIDLVQTRVESNGFTYVRIMNTFYRPGTGYFLASNESAELYITSPSTLISTTEELTFLDASSIGIKEDALATIGMELMPVPATDHVSVTFGTSGATSLEVIDAKGRPVIIKAIGTFAPGIHRYELDLAGLTAGFYNVRLTNSKGEHGTQRLVVQ